MEPRSASGTRAWTTLPRPDIPSNDVPQVWVALVITMDELLTVDELAAMLKVQKSWIYQRTRLRGQDRLPHVKVGKYVRFEEVAVREFLERRRVAS